MRHSCKLFYAKDISCKSRFHIITSQKCIYKKKDLTNTTSFFICVLLQLRTGCWMWTRIHCPCLVRRFWLFYALVSGFSLLLVCIFLCSQAYSPPVGLYRRFLFYKSLTYPKIKNKNACGSNRSIHVDSYALNSWTRSGVLEIVILALLKSSNCLL